MLEQTRSRLYSQPTPKVDHIKYKKSNFQTVQDLITIITSHNI